MATPKLDALRKAGKVDRSVPQDIRVFAEWFCAYYEINGLCDPMYVANVTAYELGRGDGQGDFDPKYNRADTKAQLAVDLKTLSHRLRHAYATSIAKSGNCPGRIQDAFDVFRKPLKWMICGCCGARYRGRQYWNQDDGFGRCDDCVERFSDICGRMGFCHGMIGIHIVCERA